MAVHELAVSVGTCTQPLSELATISVGCEEVPEPISGRRRCIWGSWHLQTAHASHHCDLWRCTTLRPGQSADRFPACNQHNRQDSNYLRCTQPVRMVHTPLVPRNRPRPYNTALLCAPQRVTTRRTDAPWPMRVRRGRERHPCTEPQPNVSCTIRQQRVATSTTLGIDESVGM